VLYAILVMPITNDAGRNLGGENALTLLASGTAGRVFTPSVGPTLDSAFADILKELRTQYFLGYYPQRLPPTRERYHRLEVTVSSPGLRVLARSGYYGEVAQPRSVRPERGPAVKEATPRPQCEIRRLMDKSKSKPKSKPPDQTLAEVKFLRYLIDQGIPVRVRLRTNEEFSGVIEFYDTSFIRLTRTDGPNLFIYKHDIKYMHEEEG